MVVGHWPRSPFGPVSDVMVEHPDGHRLLLAPQPAVAEFIATTYTFDQITLGPVAVGRPGATRTTWAPEFDDGDGIGFPCFHRTALAPR